MKILNNLKGINLKNGSLNIILKDNNNVTESTYSINFVNIVNNLKISIITLFCLISCFTYTQQVKAVENNTNNNIYVVNEYYNSCLDHIIEYNDGSFATVNINTNTYQFTASELGDWNYNCKDIKELNNLIASYNSCKGEYDNYNSIYIVNSYIKPDGSLVTEYNDKSYSIQNDSIKYYEFTPAITEDYSITFNNTTDMQKCINTYISIKNTGMY